MTGTASGGRTAALVAVLGVLFLTFLDTTIVSVTLGDIENDVSAGVIPLQWVINAYALTFASLMLVGGSLADRYGRRKLMLAGVLIFCAGSLLAALAGNVGVIIGGRALMGVGAAAAEPGTLSVIRQLFGDRAQRARALGAWSAVAGLALALGPVIGGLLVGLSGWRAVFWFNLVVGLLLALFVARVVPESSDPQAGRPDLAGFGLATVGLGSVIYAAIAGEYQGFTAWWIVSLFVLGALCLGAFVVVETRVDAPMLQLRLVARPVVAAALFGAFAVYFAVFAIFFLTALYLDLGLGYSGPKLSAMFTPMAVAIVFGGVAAGRWVARVGSRVPSIVGCGVSAVGLALAWTVVHSGYTGAGRPGVSFAPLALALAVAGLGFGVTVVPLTSTVLTHVPARSSGMAASATNTARQLGSVVGVAALGAIANSHLRGGVGNLYRTAAGKIVAKQITEHDLINAVETGGSSGFSIAYYRVNFPDVLAPFVRGFAEGLAVALVVAFVLVVLAGLAAAVAGDRSQTSTEATSAGSAPPRTASTGSA